MSHRLSFERCSPFDKLRVSGFGARNGANSADGHIWEYFWIDLAAIHE